MSKNLNVAAAIAQKNAVAVAAPVQNNDDASELARLRAENEALRKQVEKKANMYCKVSEKGAVSVYGLSRFPVTLYKSQFERLIGFIPEVVAFIKANEGKLSVKAEKAEAAAQDD